MERRIINPWSWQDEFSYVQAHEVSGTRRVLFCAGQASVVTRKGNRCAQEIWVPR